MGNYYQPEIETMPLEQLQLLQSERLVEQVKHVYKNVEFYRNKMDEAGVKPEDIHGIEDLHKLPFITKDDLRGSVSLRAGGGAAVRVRAHPVYQRHHRTPGCGILYSGGSGYLGGVLRQSHCGGRGH